MYRYKCRKCGGMEYSSSSCKADEPCQYCGGKVEFDGDGDREPAGAPVSFEGGKADETNHTR